MKIVVLDGYTANPSDLNWEGLEALGEVSVYDRTSDAEFFEHADGAVALLTNKVVLNADRLEKLKSLKYIGVLATGYNVVDTAKARELGITVTNIPAYSTMSVAQSVFAHLLAICNRVEHYTRECREGKWSSSPDFCFMDTPLPELAGKTMGIVGLGNIGMAVARIALAFGMKVKAHTRKSQNQLPDGITKSDYGELFSTSDVISLHCPLTADTEKLVNARRLEMMKPTAILINTGRGPLVDEAALADALNTGKIYAAGLDVLSHEPPLADNPLLKTRNCFITPHIAWATREARARLIETAVSNLESFNNGCPVNVVN